MIRERRFISVEVKLKGLTPEQDTISTICPLLCVGKLTNYTKSALSRCDLQSLYWVLVVLSKWMLKRWWT